MALDKMAIVHAFTIIIKTTTMTSVNVVVDGGVDHRANATTAAASNKMLENGSKGSAATGGASTATGSVAAVSVPSSPMKSASLSSSAPSSQPLSAASTASSSSPPSSPVVAALQKHWFMVGVVSVIALASWYPPLGRRGGPLMPEFTVKILAVSIIFFNSGLQLKPRELRRAVMQVKLHVLVQSFSMLIVPVAMAVAVAVLRRVAPSIHPDLLLGLRVVSCMPPPVSSAVLLSKVAGGNEAAAIFNSTLGSFVGIVVTPAWLLLTIGVSAEVPVSSIFAKMTMTVVMPLVIGQTVRQSVAGASRWKLPFSKINSCILLLIIYTTFCDTFSRDASISLPMLLVAISLVGLAQAAFMFGSFRLATLPRFGFTRSDVVAVLFASTHKSLTLGIPMLNVMFEGDSRLFYISLPLLIYHPMQILIGSTLVPSLRRWVRRQASV
eukprot:TRINITY_DN66739_c7_g1_i1.p2 TRINITY_DN66739_c7_g1~~TRINITY_DN66739_c7_g1_i1.p2  ORF type:complete len:439 (+),score=201.88 TRINITY_DN66739_c7_g1_i1:123-1439(+)